MDELLEKVKAIDLRMVMEDLGYKIVQNRRMKCPFHEDDSPSLVIYPPPQNEFHCFGCGKHGDVLNFYAEVNGISFKTALDRLAYTYIPNYEPENKRSFKNEPKLQVYNKKDPAANYVYQPIHSDIYEDFRTHCLNYPTTESTIAAVNYLRNRGLEDWNIRHNRVFMVKNYREVNAYLKEKYSVADLQSSGLINQNGNLIFYVHPIIFPYFQNGRIVYLQGRTIGPPKDRASKYQFLKGLPRPMFNSDILATLRTGKTLYITEGAIDCMTLVQYGEAAISLGSAKHFRPEWAKLLRRAKVIIWFDNDDAGRSGTQELLKTLTELGITVSSKTLPEGVNDINEYYNNKNK
ncbi:MAG: CHC2 zinc finger domain-containing protein [Spirosomaceae bacterium]|nr:CHC2 zinc finger domain-containing protein [Spirosomataceae bacterium]